jgi:hypothetical protein
MQLNKIVGLFIPLLVLGACSKKVENKLLLDHWAAKEKEVSIVERKLAAAGDAECMIDTFTVETLKAEIASIESKYTKEKKLEGSFEHLDFRDLPVTQARYLQTYGKSIGDQTKETKFDYSSCSDVPCIINKVYGQDSGVEGYAIYLWYLKTGHTLAIDNFVYDQKSAKGGEYQGKKFPLKDYLFSKDELYAFWRMSHMLSPAYKTLSNLKEIQRLPRGANFENAGSLTCGLAWNSGWVQLSDSCLTFGYSNKDSGFIYESVTHELAHEIDYHEGTKLRKTYRSQETDWLNASGWELKEERVGEGAAQRVTRTYSVKSGFNQFVSSYAQTSPAENFADTLSLYVHNGDHTKKSIPVSLYDIVKDGYYGLEEYTLDANTYRIVQKNYPRYLKDILDLTVSCLEPSGELKSIYFNGVKFQQNIPPLILGCMGNRAESLEKTVFAHIKMTEAEGCNITKIKMGGAKKLQDAWKKIVADQIDDAFGKMKNDSEYLSRIKEFYEKLSKDSDPQKVYVSCYGEKEEKSCYDAKIKELAERKVATLKPNQVQAEEMIALYIDSFQFQSIQDQVISYYQNFLKGQGAVISENSQSIWNQCLQVKPDDKEMPTGTLFNIGSSYMVSSMYNCLNYNLPNTVRDTVRGLEINGQRIKDGNEEKILSAQVMPLIVNDLRDLYSSSIKAELERISEYQEGKRESLASSVKGDFSWATNYVDNQKIIKDCKDTLLKDITIDLYFHKKSDVMDAMLSEICSPIPKSSEFNKYLDSIRGELEGKSYQTLEGYVLEEAAVVAKECLVKFPADTALNRVRFRDQREGCLKDKWSSIEKTALGRLNAEPLVIKFKIDTSGYTAKLKTRTRVLQLKTFKDYFEK